jgi:tetratricopeptide (TPR) repeat protein
MADELGLDESRALALNAIGVARCQAGDLDGFHDIERGADIAAAANVPGELLRALNNLAVTRWQNGELRLGEDLRRRAMDVARRFGDAAYIRWFDGLAIRHQFTFGDWDAALAAANRFIAEVEAGTPHYLSSMCYLLRATIAQGRGDHASAVVDVSRAIDLGRRAKDPQNLLYALAWAADVVREAGDAPRASILAGEVLRELQTSGNPGFGIVTVHVLSWTLVAAGVGDVLADALAGLPPSPWARAATEFARGDAAAAADTCAAMGAVTEEARDRLWAAEWLLGAGRRSEAEAQLSRALEFYRSVGAHHYVRRCSMLLAA